MNINFSSFLLFDNNAILNIREKIIVFGVKKLLRIKQLQHHIVHKYNSYVLQEEYIFYYDTINVCVRYFTKYQFTAILPVCPMRVLKIQTNTYEKTVSPHPRNPTSKTNPSNI